MSRKELSKYKRKYQAFRHHAWAGLGFLSVLLAIRVIFPEPSKMLTPIIFVLIIYVFVALIFTYKYRAGLYAKEEIVQPPVEKEKIRADVEKKHIKLEKKKAKAEAKARKKSK
ncbi:MAG: hypothetical protein JSW60_04205 [Thermoplasmatales archaeon]|nr:MAG: hypothetical protein JSW60_04205 [Thermoplasmatales archaeon]